MTKVLEKTHKVFAKRSIPKVNKFQVITYLSDPPLDIP